MTNLTFTLFALIVTLSSPTLAAPPVEPRPFDEATGRNPRQYPPDPVVDYLDLRLEASVDLDARRLDAREILTFIPTGGPVSSLQLDGVGMSISRVAAVDGSPIPFAHDGRRVTVQFRTPIQRDQQTAIVFTYTVTNPPAGLYFAPAAPADASHPARPAMLHSQGEDELNRYWLICHDYPNDRLTSELNITVAKPNLVVANGKLVEREDLGDGRERFHWRQEQPHVTYLISLAVGQWDVVEDKYWGKPVHYYVPLGRGRDAQRTFGRTLRMLDLFSSAFGVEYPWDKYHQVIVENFNWGGMENTSNTTLWEGAILDEVSLMDGDMDGLISHELAHQWFGDLLTCKSWDHVWLNEGFATYASAIWNEQNESYDDYLLSIGDSMAAVASEDKAGKGLPMVWNDWNHPIDAIRTPGANPYSKGASILAMLREELGTFIFFTGIRYYVDGHKFGLVDTDDFRETMEGVSGRDLRWFFDQWCYRSGTPELDMSLAWDPSSGSLDIHIAQTQFIDRASPAFRFTLPVWVMQSDGKTWKTIDVFVDSRDTVLSARLDAEPRFAVVDPHLRLCKTLNLDMPDAWWRAQLAAGPTVVARMAAAKALAKNSGDASVEALAAVLNDAKAHRRLRVAAADALADVATPSAAAALRATLAAGVDDARIRAGLITALARFKDPADVPLFVNHAQTEISYGCTAAALRALGSLQAVDSIDIIARASQTPSAQHVIQLAAIDALRDLDDPRCLDPVLSCAAFGQPYRVRPAAIAILPALAHHDKDRVLNFLVSALDDPEERTYRAAIDALADLHDSRALPALQRVADTHPLPWYRDRASWAINEINSHQ